MEGVLSKTVEKALPIAPVPIISSLLFAIGYITRGSFIIVAYDIFFIFVNSVLSGIVFYKTTIHGLVYYHILLPTYLALSFWRFYNIQSLSIP